jgi:hypothetical protein
MSEATEYIRPVEAEIVSEERADWFRSNFDGGVCPFWLAGGGAAVREVQIAASQPNVFSGGFSVQIGAGNAGGSVLAALYGYQTQASRLRWQMRLKGDGVNVVDADLDYLSAILYVYDGTTRHDLGMRLFSNYGADEKLQYMNGAGVWTDVIGVEWPTLDEHRWHFLTMDFDLTNGLTERCMLNENATEIQATFNTAASASIPYWYMAITMNVANTGDTNRVFLDSFNITRLE